MKRIIKHSILAICFAVMLPMQLKAAEYRSLFSNDKEMQEVSETQKPVVFNDAAFKELDGVTQTLSNGKTITFGYMSNRRTLTGRDCAINKIINTVDVGSGQKNLDHLLNDDLNDYGEFISTVKVGVAYNPMVSIRDNSCYYAKGTTAGFCVVAGSGNTVLALDVIKVMAITFYREGQLIKTVDIQEGQDGSGVNLSLVNIPGSDQTGVNLTAVAPCVFDEISLDFAGGANVGVGQVYRVKYAFVGESREFTITENQKNGSVVAPGKYTTPFQQYNPVENGSVNLDYVKGWNPVLLGIPFPVTDKELDKLTNEDYGDFMTLSPVVGLAYMGGAKFMMKDEDNPSREVYKAGMEVGFCYKNASALDLSLGNTIQIILFDRDGNQVQTETISSGVLGLSVAKGGDGSACIVSKVPFSGAELRFYGALEVNLGGLGVHYGFVRYQPDICHHCDINPSANVSLCSEQNSYQLISNPNISVTWTLEAFYPLDEGESTSATVTSGGLVKGLEAPGEYVFRATAADGCYELVTINYDMFPAANEVQTQGNPLVNDYDNGTYEISWNENGELSGGLIIIDGIRDTHNVIDGKYDEATHTSGLNKCATWSGLELANNQMIIGVKRTDGEAIVDHKRDKNKPNYENGTRVGFVVTSSVTGLNVSALNFWNIRCFYKGKEVYRHVIDESNAVSAALAGSDGSKQTRYSITLPWYDKDHNNMMVDEIQMWSSGVLDLRGERLNIYYGFMEGEGENGGDPLNCSATIISTSTTGATIDYSLLCNASLIQALGAMDNISYFIDDDPKMETALVENHAVGAIARVTIPVKLGRTLDFRHELGIVMRNDSYLADVKLGSGMVAYTMYRGEKTGDEFKQWGVLGADVAGYGDKQIFYIHPKRLFDEVVIDFGDGVNVLGNPQFFGLFMRSDADGDGIPDCQDPSSCTSTITDIEPDNVCQGAEIFISATGIPGYSYTVQFNDPAAKKVFGGEYAVIHTTNESDNNLTISYNTETAGQYSMVFYNGAATFDEVTGKWNLSDLTPIASTVYYVHPNYTEWRKDASSSDWNNWSNWTAGTPYCCTDVIIPDGAINYPSLIGTNEIGDEFCCNRIFIRPGAFINSINKLNYSKAWVQMELSPNCYNLISAPLKGMVTGDMFIPASYNGVHNPQPFTDLNGTIDIESQNRFNPTIYQRLWYSSANERDYSNTLKELSDLENIESLNFTKWSKNFNYLNTPYDNGMGFSVWVDNGNLPENQLFRFTFPKEHAEYNYFDDFTHSVLSSKETVNRGETVPGRFIYESKTTKTLKYGDEERNLYELPEGAEISVSESTEHFLFGNPFMSPIDARMFIKENCKIIKGIKSYDGNATASLIYDPSKDEFTEVGAVEKIAPMTAVFVEARETQTNLTISLTEEMIASAKTEGDTDTESQSLKIKASSGKLSSSMAVLTERDITNTALFDNEIAPQLAIFSTLDGEACDIVPAADIVPLTIIADKNADIRLDFISNDVNRDEWTLVDNVTKMEYPLDREIMLPDGIGTTSGRFCLVRGAGGGITSGIESIKDFDRNVYVTVNDDEIIATATEGNISSMEVYAISGIKVGGIVSSQSSLSLKVAPGIYVVCVLASNKLSTHKIMVR